MDIHREIAPTVNTTKVGRELADLTGPCVGCTTCRGVCLELIEALTLPDILLRRERTP